MQSNARGQASQKHLGTERLVSLLGTLRLRSGPDTQEIRLFVIWIEIQDPECILNSMVKVSKCELCLRSAEVHLHVEHVQTECLRAVFHCQFEFSLLETCSCRVTQKCNSHVFRFVLQCFPVVAVCIETIPQTLLVPANGGFPLFIREAVLPAIFSPTAWTAHSACDNCAGSLWIFVSCSRAATALSTMLLALCTHKLGLNRN